MALRQPSPDPHRPSTNLQPRLPSQPSPPSRPSPAPVATLHSSRMPAATHLESQAASSQLPPPLTAAWWHGWTPIFAPWFLHCASVPAGCLRFAIDVLHAVGNASMHLGGLMRCGYKACTAGSSGELSTCCMPLSLSAGSEHMSSRFMQPTQTHPALIFCPSSHPLSCAWSPR